MAKDRLPKLLQGRLPPDEAGEAARGGGVQSGPQWSGPGHLVHLDWCLQALHRHRAERLDRDIALGEAERVGGQPDTPRRRELLHAAGQVRRLANCRVIHPQVTADRPDDDFTGIQSDPDLRLDAVSAAHLLAIPVDRQLHVEGGVTGAHRVVFVGQRSPEKGHDPVAHHLVHRPLVAVDRLHHAFEHRIEKLPRLLGVAVGEQLHGALQVGKEDGHLLALAFEGGLRGDDLLGEVLRGVGLRGCEACRLGPVAVGRLPAF